MRHHVQQARELRYAVPREIELQETRQVEAGQRLEAGVAQTEHGDVVELRELKVKNAQIARNRKIK